MVILLVRLVAIVRMGDDDEDEREGRTFEDTRGMDVMNEDMAAG